MTVHWPSARKWPVEGHRYMQLVSIEPAPVNGWCRDKVTMYLRETFYKIVQRAFEDTRIGWNAGWAKARGNDVLVLLPSEVPLETLVGPLAAGLLAEVRLHNSLHRELAQLSLRMAVHTGVVRFDPAGAAGCAVQLVDTLIGSAQFIDACAAIGAELAVIVSERVYEQVLQDSSDLAERGGYGPIKVGEAGERVQAWACFHPFAGQPGRVRPYPRSARAGDDGESRGEADEAA